MEILVLCSGNIVRSPLAKGLLRKILDDIGVSDVVVASAGTLGIEGGAAHPEAVRLARERGFDLSRHRSRGVTAQGLQRADMIVVMEEAHARKVREIDPSAAGRTKLLTEFEAGREGASVYDVFDPIDGGREDFETCFRLIDRCIVNLAFELKYRHGP